MCCDFESLIRAIAIPLFSPSGRYDGLDVGRTGMRFG